MYYPDELIEEIRSRNDVVDIISGYVRLQKKGNSYFGLCPFHNEKSPSFSVTPGKQMYYCFGCGAGGNVITFLMKYENMSFTEAVKSLAERAGVSLPEPEYSEEMRRKENKRQQMFAVNKEAAKYFYYQLRSNQGKPGMEYLQGRQLSEETMKQFGLGFANVTSNDLVLYLRSKGYDDKLIAEAGLASMDERYGLHDKFWNRVMFPIQDANHRVIGFGGRVMGDGKPKYLNSPETLIFDKSRNLYGLNFARTSRAKNIILCEGYMDVIAMHQAGFNQAVASLGTAFTSGQANLIRRYAENVILAYDSDGAGVNAALRAIGILKEVGIPGKVLNMKPYKDPDEFIKNLGKEAFQERIDQAENSFFFELRILEQSFDMNDPAGRTNFHREIAKKLCEFEEEVERDNYLEAVAEKYKIGQDNLRKLVIAYASKTGGVKPIERPKPTIGNGNGNSTKSTPEENVRRSQRLLITWIVEEPEVFKKIKKYISPEDFTDDLYRQVAEKLFASLEQGTFNPAAIISMFEDEEEQQKVAELFNTKVVSLNTKEEKENAFHDIVYAVKKNSFEFYSTRLGTDLTAIDQVIQAKKALEELSRTHISLYGE